MPDLADARPSSARPKWTGTVLAIRAYAHAACLQAEAHLADRSPCGDGGATAGPVGRGRTVGADGVGAGTGAGGAGHAAALPGTVYSDSTT